MDNILKYIKNNKIVPKKFYGQNFIYDNKILEKIVTSADTDKKDIVIEIGAGIGNMTSILAEKAAFVIAVEIDSSLIMHLRENTSRYNNILILNKDFLKINIQNDIIKKSKSLLNISDYNIKVIANLPYYITSPIIMKLLKECPEISSMFMLMQKEVADRITGVPGTRTYGFLTVFIAYYGKAKKVFDISPGNFIPKPDVISTLIRIDVSMKECLNQKQEELFFKIVNAVFQQRRKTLVNSLNNSSSLDFDKPVISEALKKLGFDIRIRGENLSVHDFINLTKALDSYKTLK
jgi:16S rRNA (adenine1518-N6/adenine1519-N6)-dimethyltransferase